MDSIDLTNGFSAMADAFGMDKAELGEKMIKLVIDKVHPPKPTVNVLGIQKLTYTPEEAAAAIGVPVGTIDVWINRGAKHFPYFSAGTKRLIPVKELIEWLGDQTGYKQYHKNERGENE